MTKTEEIEQFETHMDRMERERQAQEAKLALAKEQTRTAKIEARAGTKEMLTIVLCSLIAAALVLGIAYFIWMGNKGPSASQEMEQHQRTECIQSGGTYIPNVTGSGQDGDICIIQGRMEK